MIRALLGERTIGGVQTFHTALAGARDTEFAWTAFAVENAARRGRILTESVIAFLSEGAIVIALADRCWNAKAGTRIAGLARRTARIRGASTRRQTLEVDALAWCRALIAALAVGAWNTTPSEAIESVLTV